MTVKQQIINALTWFKSKLVGSIVNNCTSTSTSLPLSAAQGKSLQDQITTLNTNLDDKVNKTDTIAIEHGGTSATTAVNARYFLLAAHSKFASVLTGAKALNITSEASYDNTYMLVVIFSGSSVAAIVILNGYRSETSLTPLGSNQYVKLYENAAYKISGISAVKNSDNTVRTKIIMENANNGYRASVINLGNNNTDFEATWVTS